MIHLACVVDAAEQALEACAHHPSDTVVTLNDELACVGQWCEEPTPPTDASFLLDHDRLVSRLMWACGSVVPFRYGTVVEDGDDVRALLAPRAQEFRELLGWLRDRVELALRAAPAPSTDSRPSPRPGQGSGASYLRALGVEAAQAPLKKLHRALAACAVAAVGEPDVHGGLKASYLVDRPQIDDFCRLLDDAAVAAGGVGPVSLTGPWAPYTFAATFAATFEEGRPAAVTAGGRGNG